MSAANISTETIQAFTNEAPFGRGMKYYKQGRVVDISHENGLYKAVVVGTDKYEVSFDTTNLEAKCNCYVSGGDIWCKHVVALALVAVNGPVASKKTPEIKRSGQSLLTHWDELEKELDGQSAATLVGIIKMSADINPDIWDVVERVLHPPVMENSADIVKAVKKAIAPASRTHSWERLIEAEIQASEDMRYVAENASPNETGVRGLLQAAVWAYKRLEQIDDSNGELQDGIASLTSRAVQIVNDDHGLMGLLYEPLAEPTDLPLVEMILGEGDDVVRENVVQRLDKHLNVRDPELAIDRDNAEYTLVHYFAERGDTRLLTLLDDIKIHENLRLQAMVRYHEVRGEWQEVVELLWPRRKEPYYRKSLRAALRASGDMDKLIELQTTEALESFNPKHELIKLEHMLREAGRGQEIEQITAQILAGGRMSIDAKIKTLIRLKRFSEAAKTGVNFLQNTAESYPYASAYQFVDSISNAAEKLTALSPVDALMVWRVLFAQEKQRVLTYTNYTHFDYFCSRLHQQNDDVWLAPQLTEIVEKCSTRKKLVEVCEKYLQT